jgi:hypothetical protein
MYSIHTQTHTQSHTRELKNLIQPVVFEFLTTMENSGSPMKRPFQSMTPTCETTRCNNPKDKSFTCDVCDYVIKHKWKVLLHNSVSIIE